MTARTSPGRAARLPRRERGIIMIVGMLFLVIMTLLGLALFRSTGLMDRVAANSRDKERSFEAAQAALQYGEYWLSQGNGGVGSACSTIATSASLHVCSNALPANFATAGFTAGFTYVPAGVSVSTAGGQVSGGGDVNYQQAPGLYIENKGVSTDGKSLVYQVTAYGFGGSTNSTSVVRSTYRVTPTGNDLGSP